MKSKKLSIVVILALTLIGATIFFILSKNNNEDKITTKNNSTEKLDASKQVKQQEAKPKVSLKEALSTIDTKQNNRPVNGSTYTLNGIEYKFEEPSSWKTSLSQRKMACEQGYINTAYQIITDGSTWIASTSYNSDLEAMVNALQGLGIKSDIVSYC